MQRGITTKDPDYLFLSNKPFGHSDLTRNQAGSLTLQSHLFASGLPTMVYGETDIPVVRTLYF